MPELKSYIVVKDGIEYRFRLTEETARKVGATPAEPKRVESKQIEPEDKEAQPENKARRARTKSED